MTSAGRHVALLMDSAGDLAFQTLHGQPLYAHALAALRGLRDAVVVVADGHDLTRVRDVVRRLDGDVGVSTRERWWADVETEPARGLLVHDVLCPLVTADFLATVLATADARPEAGVVAVRPVTDTLKAVVDGRIVSTIDRDGLVSVSSPVIVPGRLLAGRSDDDPPPLGDFAALVGWLRARTDVELVRAPSLGRRVEHARAAHVLACLDQVGHRVRASRTSGPEDRP